jgi:hypothetical protein
MSSVPAKRHSFQNGSISNLSTVPSGSVTFCASRSTPIRLPGDCSSMARSAATRSASSTTDSRPFWKLLSAHASQRKRSQVREFTPYCRNVQTVHPNLLIESQRSARIRSSAETADAGGPPRAPRRALMADGARGRYLLTHRGGRRVARRSSGRWALGFTDVWALGFTDVNVRRRFRPRRETGGRAGLGRPGLLDTGGKTIGSSMDLMGVLRHSKSLISQEQASSGRRSAGRSRRCR